jgi:hypothetical protein
MMFRMVFIVMLNMMLNEVVCVKTTRDFRRRRSVAVIAMAS